MNISLKPSCTLCLNKPDVRVRNVAGGVRGLRQPSGSLHLLFPLREKYSCPFGVEDRLFPNPDAYDHHFAFRGNGLR